MGKAKKFEFLALGANPDRFTCSSMSLLRSSLSGRVVVVVVAVEVIEAAVGRGSPPFFLLGLADSFSLCGVIPISLRISANCLALMPQLLATLLLHLLCTLKSQASHLRPCRMSP